MSKTYQIVEGYKVNLNNGHHDDTEYTENGQKEVYEYARKVMAQHNLTSIADIGCGSGYKLIKYFNDLVTMGYEVEPALSFLRDTYPDRIWKESGERSKSFSQDIIKTDVIICADVIEHLVDPDVLLKYIKSFEYKYIIISTPCREVLCKSDKYKNHYSGSYYGPPINHCHVREWTSEEFIKYLSQYFTVLESRLGIEQIECQYHLLKSK